MSDWARLLCLSRLDRRYPAWAFTPKPGPDEMFRPYGGIVSMLDPNGKIGKIETIPGRKNKGPSVSIERDKRGYLFLRFVRRAPCRVLSALRHKDRLRRIRFLGFSKRSALSRDISGSGLASTRFSHVQATMRTCGKSGSGLPSASLLAKSLSGRSRVNSRTVQRLTGGCLGTHMKSNVARPKSIARELWMSSYVI